ncbi:lysylphosphatidylglycerol synthase domain-containing protein [Rhizobium sp. NFR03]|uniref:lysylphosphatidylglycerol synthase domain-containing protein n=1 Tax=Rhizobium sp. NFR03 TaxID=1566263 RepID=UPI0008B407E3|nr:lysylphosphatidylglycerol synthase domain-containing protein [Rhizobium sp. NFR03]SES32806.1 hypothetical protein SAMN03159406_03429 [Rhizobium sp. NFR03]
MSLRLVFRVVAVAAVVFALYLLFQTLRQYTLDEILTALRAIPVSHLLLGLAFAAASYVCLSCFDALGVRYTGKRLPFHKTALASFVSLSIGHNVGVAALSSGAVRYRYYARWGLTAEDVAKIVLFCGVTVALGLMTLGGASLLLRPQDAADMTGLSRSAVFAIGIASLIAPVIYLVLSAFVRKPLTIKSWSFDLPKLPIAAAQIVVGTLNFAFVAASLHQMLSAFAEAGYLKVASVSIIANVAAIISHVPGGIGVLEATVAHILPGAESVAAVIAFRVIYYFIPLALGLPTLLISEIVMKDKSTSAAKSTSEEPHGRHAGSPA